MKTTILSVAAVLGMTFLTACNDFLDEQKPQGTVDNELLKDPQYVDNLIIPAYAYGFQRGHQFVVLDVEL